MESAAPSSNQVSSTSLDDEVVGAPELAGPTTTSSLMNDTDGIGEVWYRPPIPDPPRSKRSLRLRTNRLNEAAKREDHFPMSPSSDIVSPVLEKSATGLSTSTRRADGQPVVKRKKSIRVLASEYKRSFDEALKAWVGPHFSVESEAQEHRRPFKRLLKRKMTSDDSEDSMPTMTCKWVRGEPIENGTRMYVALNMRTGEMMALKQAEIPSIKKKHWSAKQVEDLERLKKETHILAGLEHPNVVQYLGYEETNSIYNLFLRYVSGGSMGTLIRNCGKLKETVVAFFLKQVVDGVDYLHSKGIIHHGLLADNILVEINGAIKISGFGASEKVPESILNMQQESKTAYRIAPEVMNLQRNGNNFKVDIWSVGCLFLEMMTGLGPWSDIGMIEILSQLSCVESSATPTYVPFSELANDFRRDCLATKPDERASASELRTHGFLTIPSDWNFEESS